MARGDVAQYARENGIGFDVAYQRFRRNGHYEATLYKYPTTADIRRFIEMHTEQGLSPYQIAAMTGFSRITVRRHLGAAGVYTPQPGGNPRRKQQCPR